MSRLDSKLERANRRQARVRTAVRGTKERPRLSVSVTNLHISVQIINDEAGKTLISATTIGNKALKGSMSSKAEWLGEDIAKKAKAAKIKKVVLDRGSKLYHGRVKTLADAARKSGLEF